MYDATRMSVHYLTCISSGGSSLGSCMSIRLPVHEHSCACLYMRMYVCIRTWVCIRSYVCIGTMC